MGLDLITQRNCEVKMKTPQQELLNLIKNRNRGVVVYEMLLNSGKTKEEALETEFTFTFQTLEGVKDEQVKVSKLLSDTQPILESLGKLCENCPVSRGREFGCIDYISYPISSKCEKWLASLAEEANKKGMPYSMAIVFIKDKNINGNRIKQMRAHGQTFFEVDKPAKIVLSRSLFKKDAIDTDQLLDVTFLQGLMLQTHINFLLMLYGGVVSDSNKPTDDRPFQYNNEHNKYVYLDLQLPNDADRSMVEFYNYFQHLFVALMNGCDVYMD
jgi:hypothetical protein